MVKPNPLDCAAFDHAGWASAQRFLPTAVKPAVVGAVADAMQAFAADQHFIAERRFGDAVAALTKYRDAHGAAKGAAVSGAAAVAMNLAASLKSFASRVFGQSAAEAVAADAVGGDGVADKRITPVASLKAVDMLIAFLAASDAVAIAATKSRECRKIVDETRVDNASWSPVSVDKNGDGTYYRAEPGLSSHSFKVCGTVKQDLLSLACILIELDLYTEWFPMCVLSKELGSLSRFHKLSQFACLLLWPFSNREVILDGYGLDDLEHNRVVIKATSIADGALMPNGQPQPPVFKKNVRADFSIGGFFLEAVAANETRVAFFMNADPHIPHLPPAIINYVSGKMIWVLLWQMGRAAGKAKDPTSCYHDRKQQRPDVYEYFVERIDEALASLPTSPVSK
jgi:hypothetical protein